MGLHLLLKSQLLASPLPFPAALGVLDFVLMPVPESQAGRSCFEGLFKATLSCLLPAQSCVLMHFPGLCSQKHL